jgi:phosphoribosyl-AMP cyclohydrolase
MAGSPFVSRGDKKQIELGVELAPKFDEQGLITVVAVDHQTSEVLMVAFMNEEALRLTLEKGQAVYYSRSRKKLWHKGEESGNIQKVKDLLVDCDQDCILLKVEQVGGACCHNGYRSCFYRAVDGSAPKMKYTQKDRVFDPEKVYGKK